MKRIVNIYEDNSDYYMEYYPEEFDNNYTEFWLCRQGYGVKLHVISFMCDNPEEWIAENIDRYISIFGDDFENAD